MDTGHKSSTQTHAFDTGGPLGWIAVSQEDDAIVAVDFVPEPGAGVEASAASTLGSPAPVTAPAAAAPTPLLANAERQLREYLAGERTVFELPLHARGTEFQRAVWARLAAIPYGETRTYGQIAAEVGKPLASRAVGGANNKNPLGIVVPCHRVIGASGALVGYASGVDHKSFLLNLESRTGE